LIRLAIVDDHAIFRFGLKLILEVEKDFKVEFEADNGHDLITKLNHNYVDLILLDLQMPELDGENTLQLLKEKYPKIKVIVITFKDQWDELKKIMKLDIDGLFTKNANPKFLINALKNIEKPQFFIDPLLKSKFLNGMEDAPHNPSLLFEITEREKEIILLFAKEFTLKEISRILNISPRTIETHKKNLMQKLECKNFIGVIIKCLENKVIDFNDLKTFNLKNP